MPWTRWCSPIGVVALLALASCSTSSGAPDGAVCAQRQGTPDLLVHIGPDTDMRVLCGGRVELPVASLSNLGLGQVRWQASVTEGSPSTFRLLNRDGLLCGGGQLTVVLVDVVAPTMAAVGDGFEGAVSIRAVDDAFPPGTVKIHGVVAAPSFKADRTTVEFGDVPLGERRPQQVAFLNTSIGTVGITPVSPLPSPFSMKGSDAFTLPGQLQSFVVFLQTDDVGEYTATVTFQAMAAGAMEPSACTATQTLSFHARVVGAGQDAGTGPPDGGGDDARAD